MYFINIIFRVNKFREHVQILNIALGAKQFFSKYDTETEVRPNVFFCTDKSLDIDIQRGAKERDRKRRLKTSSIGPGSKRCFVFFFFVLYYSRSE